MTTIPTLRVARPSDDLQALLRAGRTFEDPDGYRVVLHCAAWPTDGLQPG